MIGIVSAASYVPSHRLARSELAQAWKSVGTGTRSVAGYDEDTTSLGVEAARAALRRLPASAAAVSALYFATTNPAYAEKTNATAIHAALDLPEDVVAFDMNGSVRSAAGAVAAALDRARAGLATLVVIADIRGGRAGSTDEEAGGDGAAALVIGPGDDVIAELTSYAGRTVELLDRARLSDGTTVVWEERFAESVYLPMARSLLDQAFPGDERTVPATLVVGGPHRRSVRQLARALGPGTDTLAKRMEATVGNLGAAHLWAQLSAVLEAAKPGESVIALSAADGVDVFRLRTGPAITQYRLRLDAGGSLPETLRRPGRPVPYLTFLTWRGQLRREPPRRPEPVIASPPASERSHRWKFGLVATRCAACGARNLPPQRVCLECAEIDKMIDEPLADVPATVATYTVDRLAFSLSPPVIFAVVDFAGGGRLQCELTDVAPEELRIGLPVQMTFRRLYTAGGIHNYAWKARPADAAGKDDHGI